MAGIVAIKNRLGTILESGDAANLVELLKASASQDFVGIALVPDVKDKFVLGKIENAMKGNGKLDGSKVARKMTAVDARLL